jgi:ComF family protein
MPAEVCGACLSRPPPFVRTVAPLRYRGSALDLVRSLKFARSRITGRVLGELLTAAAQRAYESVTERPTVILPVPMSTRRLLRRGQNQAGVLARHVARGTGIPVDWDGCRRVRHTPPQTGQSRRVRLRNLAGAFACTRSFAGDSVAVVDDVMTTGATTLAISRALLASGAESVHVWVAARTERATMR